MDPPALGADRGRHHIDERRDVVPRDRLPLDHGLDGERRARPAGGRVLGRDRPSSAQASTASSSISSQCASRASSDQTAAISGRLYRGIKA